jgi:hypothetical protein
VHWDLVKPDQSQAVLTHRLGFWTIGRLIAAFSSNGRYHKNWAVVVPSAQVVFTTNNLLHLG